MSILWRILKWMLRFIVGFVVVAVLLGIIFFIITTYAGSSACVETAQVTTLTSTAPLAHAEDLRKIPDYCRSEETTFLTFPEWYIVYSAREFSSYLDAGKKPSGFPFFRSIAQFWCGYGVVHRYNAAHYPKDTWGNVEITTIGASYSTEYLMKGVYEKTLGRVSELFANTDTEEDIFFRKFAADYAKSLDVTPWYRYPFFPTLGKLWRETPLWGAHPVRKWERKFALSLEFIGEGVWGFLMEKATNDTGVYPPAATEIKLFVALPLPQAIMSDPRVRVEKDFGDGTGVVVVPRYQEFTSVVSDFATNGVKILDISGARVMLTTAFASSTWKYDLPGTPMFTEQLPTDPNTSRIGAIVPVPQLLEWIRAAKSEHVDIEHLYDY